jgi:hypothetical protein
MELTFADRKLARTCNSQQLMAARWGAEASVRVAERLVQLAAVSALDEVPLLPFARVEPDTRDVVRVVFDGGGLVVHGTFGPRAENARGATRDAHLCIERVDVLRKGGRG